jgi:hypothetical protein
MLVGDWMVFVGVGEGVGWWNRRRPFGEEWKVKSLGFEFEMVRYPVVFHRMKRRDPPMLVREWTVLCWVVESSLSIWRGVEG